MNHVRYGKSRYGFSLQNPLNVLPTGKEEGVRAFFEQRIGWPEHSSVVELSRRSSSRKVFLRGYCIATIRGNSKPDGFLFSRDLVTIGAKKLKHSFKKRFMK